MTGLVLACVQQYCQDGRSSAGLCSAVLSDGWSSAGLCSAVLYLPYVH